MVETIAPVVYGHRTKTYRRVLALHVLGATLAAGLLGAGLGMVGWLIGAPAATGAALVAAVALAYFAREAFGLAVPIPQSRRQVPQWWRTYFSGEVAGFLYGMGLGVGFLTTLGVGTFVVATAGAFAQGDPVAGALVCAPFGAARALGIGLVHALPSARNGGDVVMTLDSLATSRLPRVTNAVLLLATGVMAGTVLMGGSFA